jgi:BirA family biotin operon repressor/biotin-[acetyl-CoA-carboxylase] ligase
VTDAFVDAVARGLPTRWLGRTHRHSATTGSTNDDAAAWLDAPHGALVTADAQHAGRGRHGRTWYSPADAHLYASVVLRPAIADARWAALGLVVGLGLRDGLGPWCDRVRLKWPNDLVVDGRKLAGILCEARWQGSVPHIVVGFGVNLAATAFPPELADIGTTLETLTGTTIDRAAVLAAILGGLEPRLDQLGRDGFAAMRRSYEAACASIGGRAMVEVDGETCEVAVLGVDDDGALRVRRAAAGDGAVFRVTAGELRTPGEPTAPHPTRR